MTGPFVVTGLLVVTGLTRLPGSAGLAAAVDAETTTQDTGSPGILGFVATFVLALAVIGLMISLTRHLRRVAASPEPPDPDAEPDDGGSDDTVPDDTVPGEAGRGPDGAGGSS